MNAFSFDNRGRAYVSEQEFMDYLSKSAYHDDYTQESREECQVNDKDWKMCECLLYFNGGGCLLARYNRDFSYGELF